MLTASVDDLEIRFGVRSQARIPQHQLGVTRNGVHRGTDFVTHARQKRTLGPVGGVRLHRNILKPFQRLVASFSDRLEPVAWALRSPPSVCARRRAVAGLRSESYRFGKDAVADIGMDQIGRA